MAGQFLRALTGRSAVQRTMRDHFHGMLPGQIVTAAREFPITSRVDVQAALEQWLAKRGNIKLLGIHSPVSHETPTIAQLVTPGPFPTDLGPLQHDEVDIGDPTPVRCLKNGLWLAREAELPFAILLGPSIRMGSISGVHVEIGVPAGEGGAQFSQEFFRELELRVGSGRTYRGRVLSLETGYNYSGQAGALKVHRLHKVTREEVILPQKTLNLLDRNVGRFVAARERIKSLHFSAKKGLLFYGPPGTGKTHTIHYLASQLPDHTTLLITGERSAYWESISGSRVFSNRR